MITFKNKLRENYTQVPNELIYQIELSWKAKGIFGYLCSRPSDWQFYVEEIVKHASDGKQALQTGLDELEKSGWLARRNRRNKEDGSFAGMEWIIDFPEDYPSDGKPRQRENPSNGKSPTTNTDNTNTEKDNKKEYIPERSEVVDYFLENGYSKQAANKFYDYYNTSVEGTSKQYWRDGNDNKVKNWKMKAQSVWFKPENESQNPQYKIL